jgi:hypothetical protein
MPPFLRSAPATMEFSIKLLEASHGCRPVEQIHAAAVLSRLGLGRPRVAARSTGRSHSPEKLGSELVLPNILIASRCVSVATDESCALI